ncbi:AraC family transcriptional regulator [Neorhizobium sp. NCHU2750]|uniref:AraC family transcriptional regulator n=1 Tax=Neorhizobium sp. NCHU2750 TaxID=1825976 RepID=UPI000EB6292B|nr:AraC family transcriptional regulator [Neorhizobium sp. NCHU2750]
MRSYMIGLPTHFPEAVQIVSQTDEFRPEDVRRATQRTLVHRYMDWGTVRADLVKRTGLFRQETLLAPKHHVIMINLMGDAKVGEDFIDGKRVTFTPRRPGSIVFVPACREWRGWDEGDRTGSYLMVAIRRAFVAKFFGIDHFPDLKPVLGVRDPAIESSLQLIAAELAHPDPISRMMVESQAIQMFVNLARLRLLALEPAKGGLSSFDLRRTVATIESRVADPPSLDELAQEIGLSQRQFFRAFKQSTGKTPHAYMLEHRLERAADLLRTTDRLAIDIALECGFASPSHFTTVFRNAFATSPIEFRRNWRR